MQFFYSFFFLSPVSVHLNCVHDDTWRQINDWMDKSVSLKDIWLLLLYKYISLSTIVQTGCPKMLHIAVQNFK